MFDLKRVNCIKDNRLSSGKFTLHSFGTYLASICHFSPIFFGVSYFLPEDEVYKSKNKILNKSDEEDKMRNQLLDFILNKLESYGNR